MLLYFLFSFVTFLEVEEVGLSLFLIHYSLLLPPNEFIILQVINEFILLKQIITTTIIHPKYPMLPKYPILRLNCFGFSTKLNQNQH